MKMSRSLASSPSFERFVLDQLADLGPVSSKKMFGGVGLYRGEVFFGIIARDELYLKVDERTRERYEHAGMHPFKPYPGRSGTMTYYAVPVGVLESAMEVVAWARDALVAGSTPKPRARR
jgi:DNA transformation protein